MFIHLTIAYLLLNDCFQMLSDCLYSCTLLNVIVSYLFCCVAVMLFQEVWGKSFCRTIEKLVEVVQEYPGEVEHIFSPACVPLVRCAGCCGDENLECHPTLTSNTTMQVRTTILFQKKHKSSYDNCDFIIISHSCDCLIFTFT